LGLVRLNSGGQNSCFNSVGDKYDVYTFDVTEPTREKHFYLDLAQPIEDLIKYLDKLPKPDIIVASPLCQSFSSILTFKGGGTCFWKKENDKLVERSVEEFERLKGGFTKNLKADQQLFIKRLGEKCLENTLSLIDHYHPTC
jgi:DNA replication initiation complex subunit (GINS family)